MTQHHLSKTPRPRASASASATTVLVVLAAAAALLVPSVQAGPVLWVGQGTNNLWDNPANWQPNTIPQPADDVTIPGGFDVLIGTVHPATAGSIAIGGTGGGSNNTTASLHIIGANLTLGAGGLALRAASQLLGNNANIDGKGTIRVLDTSLFDFYGNRVSTPVTVASTAEARFSGAAARFAFGPWVVDGRLVFQGSGDTGIQQPVNVSQTGSVVATGSARLSLTVNNAGQVASNTTGGYLEVVNTAAGAAVTVANGLNGLRVTNGVLRANQFGAGSVTLTNVTAHGYASSNALTLTNATLESGWGLNVYFSGDNTVGSLVSYGLLCLSESGTGSLRGQQLVIQGTNMVLNGCSVVASNLSLTTTQGNPGPGTVTAETATIAFRGINDGVNYTITKAATVTGTANFGGQFTVAPGAVVDISQTELYGERGPGSWVNQGTTRVGDNQRARLTWFALRGGGVYSVGRNATFDVQNINATLGEIHFGGPAAEFTAEGVDLGWGRLTGTADGERIGVTSDMVYSECQSPCPASPQRPRQQLFIHR